MVIKIRKKLLLAALAVLILGGAVCLALGRSRESEYLLGGRLHAVPCPEESIPVSKQEEPGETALNERFQRPSKSPPYPNPYSFGEGVGRRFENPDEVLLAYYAILQNASNMPGYSGGCGTIGQAGEPYPYAYELLTEEAREELSLKEFQASFQGVGHLTLLKLLPAYAPGGTPSGLRYYMVEVEEITGRKEENAKGSLFAYYYGLATVQETEDGWKLQKIDYLPEDFLCAPWHSWFYLADAVVQIVYGNNLHLIGQIDRTEQEGDMLSVFASGDGRQYRFDFVRLTNGYDILLHEYLLADGVWQETSLLPEQWQYLKLTPERFENESQRHD